MKTYIIIGILFMFNMEPVLAQQSSDAGVQKTMFQNIELLDTPKDVPGNLVKVTIKSSLNLRTMRKIKEDALTALKLKALENGYSQLWIDSEASESRRYNKRSFRVTLVARGYL